MTGRATVFKDEKGQPQVQDFEQTITLSTPYRDGLYATVRPDYMVPTRDECPNGRIGLNIEKGSGKYRVFLTKTPDEGVLTKPREIFTDPINTNGYNKLWGSGLKPGHYALTVSDGCMERDIPDAEILECPTHPRLLGPGGSYAGFSSEKQKRRNSRFCQLLLQIRPPRTSLKVSARQPIAPTKFK